MKEYTFNQARDLMEKGYLMACTKGKYDYYRAVQGHYGLVIVGINKDNFDGFYAISREEWITLRTDIWYSVRGMESIPAEPVE
jgi:hypothetical protein